MTIDHTGGMAQALDFARVEPPSVEGFGENHAVWIFADDGRHAILHQHLNAPAGSYGGDPALGWAARAERFTIAMPGGRRLAYFGQGFGTTSERPTGGRLAFRCEDPFRRWTGGFAGPVRDTTAAGLIAGPAAEAPQVEASFAFEAIMAAPPWIQGALLTKAGLPPDAEGMGFIGGDRYEQLFRGTATVQVGAETVSYACTGLRTHRWGPRNTAAMLGHSWLTALFPSGRAFGLMRFPRADGTVGFSEGFVFSGDGELNLAEVLDSPWLTHLQDAGERFLIRLRVGGETIEIAGETAAHTINHSYGNIHNERGFTMSHGMVRCDWDGETAYGLIERSGFCPEAQL